MLQKSLIAFGLAAAMAAVASAQTSNKIPRTADGHPDLSGMYDLATLTPVERPNGLPAVMTDEEAAKREKQAIAVEKAGAVPIDGNRTAPPKGGDGSLGPAGNVGGYNSFWIDRGNQYTVIDGQKRTSIVVDPPTGRVPALTAAARERMAARTAYLRQTSDQGESKDPGLGPPGSYDDPERLTLAERCLLGFGSTSGPPILPNYFYNNLHQIVQTPDTVMILTEMVHDARVIRMGPNAAPHPPALPDYFYNNLHQIVQTPDSVLILTEMVHDARVVRMNAEHVPPTVRKWMGDSVGRWEGDTLVVDTTNFTEKTRFRGSSPDLHVVERFTRTGPKTLLYRFTIDDPKTWAKPWTGEYTWPITSEHLYEYACHEGNYAMGNILRGARMGEDAKKTDRKQ